TLMAWRIAQIASGAMRSERQACKTHGGVGDVARNCSPGHARETAFARYRGDDVVRATVEVHGQDQRAPSRAAGSSSDFFGPGRCGGSRARGAAGAREQGAALNSKVSLVEGIAGNCRGWLQSLPDGSVLEPVKNDIPKGASLDSVRGSIVCARR